MPLKRFLRVAYLGLGTHEPRLKSCRARRNHTLGPRVEYLERRIVLSTYLWTALGDGQTWTDPQNWLHFDPKSHMQQTGSPTPFADVVFPPIATLPKGTTGPINFNSTFVYFPLNSLTIDDSYTFDGNPIAIDQTLSLNNPIATSGGGTVASILLDGLKFSAGATISSQAGSTLQIAATTDPTGLQLGLQGNLIKSGGGGLVINTQSITFPTTPTLLPVPVSIAGGSITLGASVNLNAINFQVASASSLVIADNVTAGIGTLTGTGLVNLDGTAVAGDQTSLTVLVPVATTDQFTGLINGDGKLIKAGNGTLITGTIDFNGGGAIESAAGTLDVFGSISAGSLQVDVIAAFGGLGTWSFSGPAVFQNGATLIVTLNGTTPGSQYTQLVDTDATSGINLGLSTLAATIGYAYEQGDLYTFLSAPVIQGGFQNVVSGRTILGGSVPFAVSTTTSSMTLAPLQSVTTTLLSSSGNPSNPGAPVTFTAVVSTRTAPVSTGTVSFMAGTTTIAVVPVNALGIAPLTTTTLPLGTSAITAVYNGAPGNLGSSSPTVTQTVVPFATTTSIASSGDPSLLGQPVIFTASVRTGVGPVTAGTITFRRGRRFLGTVAVDGNGIASLAVASLSVGTAHPGCL